MHVSEIARRVMVALTAIVVIEGMLVTALLHEAGGLAVVVVAAFFTAVALYAGPRAARDSAEAPGVIYTVIAGLALLLGLLMIDPLATAVLHHHVATALAVFIMPMVVSVVTGGAAFAVALSGGRKR